MRLFVAVEIPDDLREAIESEIVDPLRDRVPGARWTRPEGRHLTLKFLGKVDDERVRGITAALGEAVAGHRGFDAIFAELGGFPNLRRPRVLWIGIGDGASDMASVAGSVEAALAPLGFPSEDRPFRCHLTLARFKQPGIVDVPAPRIALHPFAVTEIVLFRSHLHPKGARYEVLERFALAS